MPLAEDGATSNKIKWAALRDDYIAQNLSRREDDPPYTLKRHAEIHDLNYTYLRARAGRERWSTLLKEELDKKRSEVMERIGESAIINEIEIRTRHCTYARKASSLAYERLNSMTAKDISKLSIRDAVDLLKLGLDEEKKALGLEDGASTGTKEGTSRVLTDAQVFAVARQVISKEEPKQIEGPESDE